MAKPGIHMVLDEEEAQAVQHIKDTYNIRSTRGAVKASLRYLAYGELPIGEEDHPELEDVWVSSAEGAQILTEQTDHEIKPAYVRELARYGLVRSHEQDGIGHAGKVNLYNARDCHRIHVKRRTETTTQTTQQKEKQHDNTNNEL